MACTETYSTLVIVSNNVDPEDIEKILKTEGTSKRSREPNSKYRHRRENGVWKWCTKEFLNSTDNSSHIQMIIEKFRGKSEELRKLRGLSCKTELWSYWDSTGQGGPSLNVKTMQELVKLELDIVWDIYFDDQTEQT